MSLTHLISVLNQNIKLFRGNEQSRFIFVSMNQHLIISFTRKLDAVAHAYKVTPSVMINQPYKV